MYENLKALRKSLGMTQKEFGHSVGIAKTTYYNYETGKRKPNDDFWKAVASKYNVTIDYLMGYSNDPKLTSDEITDKAISDSEMEHIKKYRTLDEYGRKAVSAVLECEHRRCIDQAKTEIAAPIETDVIPLFEPWQAASAGYGQYADDETDEVVYVYRNSVTAKADYIMRVVGNSMEPKIFDNQRVLVHAQSRIELGETGLFIVGGERYIKIYRGDHLESINTDYPDIQLDESSICTGKVLGILKEEWIAQN